MSFFSKRILSMLVILMGIFYCSNLANAVPLWQNVGSATFTAGGAQFTALALTSTGTPYIAFEDGANADKATVMMYNGSSWSTVGSAGFSAGSMFGTSIALSPSDTPYIAYFDDANGDKATVMKYNSVSSTWTAVGGAGFTPNRVNSLAFALDTSGTPYVAYEDFTTSKANVMKYNGSTWVAVGSTDFSTGTAPNIALALSASGTPYVAFSDGSSSNKTTVMTYNGSSWVVVGSTGFTSSSSGFNSLAVSPTGTLYLADSEGAFMSPQKANVRMFNGSSWVSVGSADFSVGDATYINLVISPAGTLYLGYQDTPNSFKATVMTYNGSSWVAVGSADFSAGSSQYNSLALSTGNKLYMGYQDGGFGGGATVMSYTLPSAPSQVTGLSVNPLGSTRLALSWTTPSSGSSAITGYQIERETPIGGGFSAVTSTATASTSFTDSGLIASTTYNYRVSAINAVATGTASVTVATTTPYTIPPLLTSPAASSTYNDNSALTIGYTLPMAMLSGSLRLSFTPASGTVVVVNLNDVLAGSHMVTLTPSGGIRSASGVVSSSADLLLDGVYTITLSYQDQYGDTAASASVANVLIKPPATPAPTLTTPVSSNNYVDSNVLTIDYTLPAAALANSLTVLFAPTSGVAVTMVLPDETAGRHTFTLTPVSGIFARPVIFTSSDSIPDNTYTVSLSYRDVYGNPAVTTTATYVVIAPPAPASPSSVSYGGGGSGSWFFSSSPPVVLAATTSESSTLFTRVINQPAAPTASPLAINTMSTTPLLCTTPLYLKKPIRYGAKNNPEDVKLLQQFLNTYQNTNLPVDGTYSKADVDAVIGWQEQYAADILTPWGITKGTGYVYANSLKVIKKIVSAACGREISLPTTSNSFTRILQFGSRGLDVKALQQFLNTHGFPVDTSGVGSAGKENTLYGTLTAQAVSKFQEANAQAILTPYGFSRGTGVFGPATIKVVETIIHS